MRERNWEFNVYLNSDEKAMLAEKTRLILFFFNTFFNFKL